VNKSDFEFYNFFNSGNREVHPVKLDDLLHPIYLRRGTSDHKNFWQVFDNKEYLPIFEKIASPQVILDLGAYIGLSAIYFKFRCPDAKIICVEPSPENYKILEMNTAPYDDIHTIEAAVWHNNNKLASPFQLDGDWGNRIAEDEKGDIESITINDIIKKYKLKRIDFLKMDVEGSERNIFENNAGWINKVNCATVELHDRYIYGCKQAFDSLFTPDKFDISFEGELTIAMRKEVR